MKKGKGEWNDFIWCPFRILGKDLPFSQAYLSMAESLLLFFSFKTWGGQSESTPNCQFRLDHCVFWTLKYTKFVNGEVDAVSRIKTHLRVQLASKYVVHLWNNDRMWWLNSTRFPDYEEIWSGRNSQLALNNNLLGKTTRVRKSAQYVSIIGWNFGWMRTGSESGWKSTWNAVSSARISVNMRFVSRHPLCLNQDVKSQSQFSWRDNLCRPSRKDIQQCQWTGQIVVIHASEWLVGIL